jgi:hypothetical protein
MDSMDHEFTIRSAETSGVTVSVTLELRFWNRALICTCPAARTFNNPFGPKAAIEGFEDIQVVWSVTVWLMSLQM